jgi:hypothetical protein
MSIKNNTMGNRTRDLPVCTQRLNQLRNSVPLVKYKEKQKDYFFCKHCLKASDKSQRQKST